MPVAAGEVLYIKVVVENVGNKFSVRRKFRINNGARTGLKLERGSGCAVLQVEFSRNAEQNPGSVLGKLEIRKAAEAHPHPFAQRLLFGGELFCGAFEDLLRSEELSGDAGRDVEFVEVEFWSPGAGAQEEHGPAVGRGQRFGRTTQGESSCL